MIEVNNLTFSYNQQKSFIDNVSFSVREGEIFGFLGPSGAGKSTIQKILCGILRKYSGSVKVLDIEVKNRNREFYEKIGVDFEFPNLYGKFTGLENLEYFSSLYDRKSLDPVPFLDRLGLADHANKKVADYSKGMKMRLAFIRSILHQPQLIFLDEPTSGLDPTYARIMKDMILEQKNEGRTIILTTHNMHDAEELCDRVAFIVDGDIKAIGEPFKLKDHQRDVEVNYTYMFSEITKYGKAMLSSLHQDDQFMKLLQEGKLVSIHSKEPKLEDVFIELTGRHLI